MDPSTGVDRPETKLVHSPLRKAGLTRRPWKTLARLGRSARSCKRNDRESGRGGEGGGGGGGEEEEEEEGKKKKGEVRVKEGSGVEKGREGGMMDKKTYRHY